MHISALYALRGYFAALISIEMMSTDVFIARVGRPQRRAIALFHDGDESAAIISWLDAAYFRHFSHQTAYAPDAA